MDWLRALEGVGGIGQECLRKLMGLINSDCRNECDWSKMFEGMGWIGQECLREWVGLVENVCRNGWDWSRVFEKVCRIERELLWFAPAYNLFGSISQKQTTN